MRKINTVVLAAGLAGLIAVLARWRAGVQVVALPGTAEPRLQPVDMELRTWVDEVAREVAPARLRADIERLPAPRSRLHAPEAMSRAGELILRGFREAGWAVERHPFTFTDVPGYLDLGPFPGGQWGPTVYSRLERANLLATKEGRESTDAIVVLGHHDTVRDSPGANDNTASVAALLELARVLGPYSFRCSVILVATDMEEIGLFAARALASKLTQERRVLAAINYETMAYTSTQPNSQSLPPGLGLLYPGQVRRVRERQLKADFACVIYNGPATQLAASFASALAHLAGPHAPWLLRDPKDIPVLGKMLARVPIVRNFARGDHVPFWEEDVPALFVNDTANFRYRHYHQPTDTPEKLDYERLAAIVGATASVLARTAKRTST